MNKNILTILAAFMFAGVYLNRVYELEFFTIVLLFLFISSITLIAVPNFLYEKAIRQIKFKTYIINKFDVLGMIFFSSISIVLMSQDNMMTLMNSILVSAGSAIFITTLVKITKNVTNAKSSISQTNLTVSTGVNNKVKSINNTIFYLKNIVLIFYTFLILQMSFNSDIKNWTYVAVIYFFLSIALLIPIAAVTTIWRVATYNPEFKKAKEIQWNSIIEVLNNKNPEIILYHSGPVTPKLTDAIKMLKQTAIPYVIVCREQEVYNNLKAKKAENLIICAPMVNLESLILPSVKAILYTNNRAKNGHMIRFHQVRHVLFNAPINALDLSPSYGMFTSRIIKKRENGVVLYDVNNIDNRNIENVDFDIALSHAIKAKSVQIKGIV